MKQKEVLKKILQYIKLDHEIANERESKNDAIRVQDFAKALTHREKEIELVQEFMTLGEELRNIKL